MRIANVGITGQDEVVNTFFTLPEVNFPRVPESNLRLYTI